MTPAVVHTGPGLRKGVQARVLQEETWSAPLRAPVTGLPQRPGPPQKQGDLKFLIMMPTAGHRSRWQHQIRTDHTPHPSLFQACLGPDGSELEVLGRGGGKALARAPGNGRARTTCRWVIAQLMGRWGWGRLTLVIGAVCGRPAPVQAATLAPPHQPRRDTNGQATLERFSNMMGSRLTPFPPPCL
jgi:hypothetical protein